MRIVNKQKDTRSFSSLTTHIQMRVWYKTRIGNGVYNVPRCWQHRALFSNYTAIEMYWNKQNYLSCRAVKHGRYTVTNHRPTFFWQRKTMMMTRKKEEKTCTESQKEKKLHINLNDGDHNLNRRWCVYVCTGTDCQPDNPKISRDLFLCHSSYVFNSSACSVSLSFPKNSNIINDDGSLRVKH